MGLLRDKPIFDFTGRVKMATAKEMIKEHLEYLERLCNNNDTDMGEIKRVMVVIKE